MVKGPSKAEKPGRRRQRLAVLFLLTFMLLVYALKDRVAIDWAGDLPINLLVLQLAVPGEGESAGLRLMNGDGDASLSSIAKVMTDEYERYNPGWRPDVRVTAAGPYPIEVSAPDLAEGDLSPVQTIRRNLAFIRHFRTIALDLGHDFDDFDARIIVLLKNGTTTNDMEGRSAASSKYRFGVVHLDSRVPDPEYAVVTIFHEIGHALGATDKYGDDFRGVWPEGFAEPYLDPKFPQKFAEIMAVDIPLAHNREREPNPETEVRVGHLTAYEWGWIDEHEMRGYYDKAGGLFIEQETPDPEAEAKK